MTKRPQRPGEESTITACVCQFRRKRGGPWETGLWIQEAERIVDMTGKMLVKGVYDYDILPCQGTLVVHGLRPNG